MTRRDWWLGVLAIVTIVLLHALIPRYEYRNLGPSENLGLFTRIDRWTGRAEVVAVTDRGEQLGQRLRADTRRIAPR